MIIISWNCRGVAASATASELRELCMSSKPTILFLMETKAQSETPWSLIGDFNVVLHPHEKDGLHPPNGASMQLFRNFLYEATLMDFEMKGSLFTWFSNPRHGVVTREKLDKVLVNASWRLQFPNAIATTIQDLDSILLAIPKLVLGLQARE
ncbi:Endonuclease/exonuclease/phosphatase superfamily [Sesbania bispinosa]|nr:Endonuclease/exonuclease/phosphatase superfamily [Sesbania bispinosa]